MIWLTWRQFRAQASTAVAALAAFAVVLAVTESHMSSLYAASGLTACHRDSCAGLASQYLVHLTSGQSFPLLPDGSNEYVIFYFLSVLVILIAPAITGIFWGAPLIARELETGTCRLAWNQSITRTRWLTVKLTLTGVAAMAVTEAFSLLQAWWAAPIGRAVGLGGSASILTEGRFVGQDTRLCQRRGALFHDSPAAERAAPQRDAPGTVRERGRCSGAATSR